MYSEAGGSVGGYCTLRLADPHVGRVNGLLELAVSWVDRLYRAYKYRFDAEDDVDDNQSVVSVV